MCKRNRPHIFAISLLILLGFGAASIFSYLVSLTSLRHQIEKHALPLTSDTIYSEVQRDLLRPIFISSLMARDTFLRDWVLRGELDVNEITRYLREIQSQYGTETSFFVSQETGRYYYYDGILKTVSPEEPRDAWYYRLQGISGDYEVNLDVDMAHRDALTVFINYKVFDYQGSFIGASGVGLGVSAVTDTIGEYQKRYARNICFFDLQGNITLAGSHFLKEKKNIREIPGLGDLFEEMTARESGTFQYHGNGDVYHVNVRFIPEFHWYLLVEQGEGEVKRHIFFTLLLNLGICGILAALVIISMRALVEGYEKKLESMAVTDKLTGVYNRHAFQIFFQQALQEYERTRTPFSLLMIDLDDFKKINDVHGHLFGDEVLRGVATIFRDNLRGMDILARWGGEEFVVLLKACPLEFAFERGELFRKQIMSASWTSGKGETVRMTISFGAVQHERGESGEALLLRADEALYRAKRKDKNRGERG